VMGSYNWWTRLNMEIGIRHIDLTPLRQAVSELENSPEANTLQGHVALALGYWQLDGASDRVMAHLKAANDMDPTFIELYRQIALAQEDRLNGRAALYNWQRYLYGTTAVTNATTDANEHVAKLMEKRIEQPFDGAEVSGDVEIRGSAMIDDFQYFKVEYSTSWQPDNWIMIGETTTREVEHGLLAVWPAAALPPGEYRLRLTVVDNSCNYGPMDEIAVRIAGMAP
jgi:hypothetical protein